MRQAEARHPDEPRDVDSEHGRLVLLARLVERCAPEGEAGVVEEDVEAAEPVEGLGDEPVAALRIGHVEREGDLGLEPLDAARAPGDADTGAGKGPGGRPADPRGGAGHDRALAREVELGHRATLVMWPVTLRGSRVASTKRCKDAGSGHSQSYGCD
jgi:hypothetical protein